MSETVIIEEATGAAAMRRCVAARAPMPAAAMIRFVVGPDAALVPDLAGRLPGRGLWVTAERASVERAMAKNLFAKAARAQVAVSKDLADRLEDLLVRRCLDLLGLARRAGVLVAGFDQVMDWLKSGHAAMALVARDAAADGRRKIAAAAGPLPVIVAFDRAEQGRALGRDEAVHLALAAHGVQRRLLVELRRLHGFRDMTLPVAEAAGSKISKD